VFVTDRLPRWLRTAFVHEDGEVYLPCGAFGNEAVALVCLATDGVTFVQDEGHVYAPSAWLAALYPNLANNIRAIAGNVTRRLPTAVDVTDTRPHDAHVRARGDRRGGLDGPTIVIPLRPGANVGQVSSSPQAASLAVGNSDQEARQA
jgi:hypothetical protein